MPKIFYWSVHWGVGERRICLVGIHIQNCSQLVKTKNLKENVGFT